MKQNDMQDPSHTARTKSQDQKIVKDLLSSVNLKISKEKESNTNQSTVFIAKC